jgi:haloacetate dehalogenase
MFEGFSRDRIDVGGATIHFVRRGSGPPLLLLHGYPQTHVMWHLVAPRLAEEFTVIAADLRGYGDSSKPEGDAEHARYSKRAMAQDQVELMERLGFASFFLAGHDRGGRVAHRMALDHPQRVRKLAVLDIVPTRKMFASVDQYLATVYFHWFFLLQPHPFPERLIGHDPEYFIRSRFAVLSSGAMPLADDAVAEYVRCFKDPASIHATCEDYRAAASIDLVHDEEDLARKMTCTVLALWGDRGRIARAFDVLATWRERAVDVHGRALPCGHYLPEEAPGETLAELRTFFRDGTG